MNDAQWVEMIVREVMRRLQSAAPDSSPRQLHVDDRVVTLATLRGKLDGVHEVVVRRNAVVTPAVRDELKDRGIALVRQ